MLSEEERAALALFRALGREAIALGCTQLTFAEGMKILRVLADEKPKHCSYEKGGCSMTIPLVLHLQTLFLEQLEALGGPVSDDGLHQRLRSMQVARVACEVLGAALRRALEQQKGAVVRQAAPLLQFACHHHLAVAFSAGSTDWMALTDVRDTCEVQILGHWYRVVSGGAEGVFRANLLVTRKRKKRDIQPQVPEVPQNLYIHGYQIVVAQALMDFLPLALALLVLGMSTHADHA
jgi:hypothetical protein